MMAAVEDVVELKASGVDEEEDCGIEIWGGESEAALARKVWRRGLISSSTRTTPCEWHEPTSGTHTESRSISFSRTRSRTGVGEGKGIARGEGMGYGRAKSWP